MIHNLTGYAWLMLAGNLLILVSCLIIIKLTYQYYKRRPDIKRFWVLFLLTILFVGAQIVTNMENLVNLYYPIPGTESVTVFGRGILSALMAFYLYQVYPTLLQIPSREELQEAYSLYEARNSISLEGTISTKNGQMYDANENACRIYGYTKNELLHLDVRNLIHPEDLDLVLTNIQNQHQEAYECRGIKKDGSVLYLEVRGKNIKHKGEKIRITAIRDHTKETLKTEKLKEDIQHAWVKMETQETKNRILKKLDGTDGTRA